MSFSERAQAERAALALLTGPQAGDLLRTALRARGRVHSWRVHRIHHRPGAGITVGYTVTLKERSAVRRRVRSTAAPAATLTAPPRTSSPPGTAALSGAACPATSAHARAPRSLYLLASTARLNEAALAARGGITLTLADQRVHLWEYPYDPELPALALASDAARLGALCGYGVNVELLSYRPTRRAVLRIEADLSSAGQLAADAGHAHSANDVNGASDNAPSRDAGTLTAMSTISAPSSSAGHPPTANAPRGSKNDIYAKVVRPAAQADLERRIKLLVDSGAPGVDFARDAVGQPLRARGLVLTQAAPGVPLSRFYAALAGTPAEQLQNMLNELEATLDSLPKTAMLFPRQPAWADRAAHYAHAAGVALPGEAQQAQRVAHDINALLHVADLGEMTAVHGDFYEANVYIDPDSWDVTALLDVDAIGPGYRVHDWGCLLGHLAVLTDLAPTRYSHTDELCELWFTELARRVDPVALCASTAGVVLSLVAGARKNRGARGAAHASKRLAIATEWVKRGHEIARNPRFSATVIPLYR